MNCDTVRITRRTVLLALVISMLTVGIASAAKDESNQNGGGGRLEGTWDMSPFATVKRVR